MDIIDQVNSERACYYVQRAPVSIIPHDMAILLSLSMALAWLILA